ncbi:hypothetical protein ACKI2N_012520 [Cupriavidus sp. 30B13]|uniref:hypothetical protein n=1 Tax=Cupriavidus sp. 30B13 TaxID=3384241 RepID=UPI003B8F4E63
MLNDEKDMQSEPSASAQQAGPMGVPDAVYCALQYVEHSLAAIANRQEIVGDVIQRIDSIGAASKRAKAALNRLQAVAHHFEDPAPALSASPAAPAPAAQAKDDFLAGICVALACVQAQDHGTLWREIVRTVGEEDLLQYAAHVEPEEWELAGFANYAKLELNRNKPRKLAVSRQQPTTPAEPAASQPSAKALTADAIRLAAIQAGFVGDKMGLSTLLFASEPHCTVDVTERLHAFACTLLAAEQPSEDKRDGGAA